MSHFTQISQVHRFILILLLSTSCTPQQKPENLSVESIQSIPTAVKRSTLLKSASQNPGDNVHAALQDRAGQLWFGTTFDGVFRYDGKEFTQYTVEEGLNSNAVWSMLEDRSGVIWAGTGDGISRYENGVFSRVGVSDTVTRKFDVWSIYQDRGGKLWFATGIGVLVYDGKTFTAFEVMERKKDCPFGVEYVLEDNAGNFWFGGRCNPGVFRYDGRSVTHLSVGGDNWAWPVLQDKRGDIWFSNWSGTYRYDGKTFTPFNQANGLPGKVVTRITEDRAGNLWFACSGGIARYDGKSITNFTAADGLANADAWAILEDRSGNIWLGTRETGLYRYDGKIFTKFSE